MWFGNAGAIAEKVGMRYLKSSVYNPHPSPLPKGISIYITFQYNKNNGLPNHQAPSPAGEQLCLKSSQFSKIWVPGTIILDHGVGNN
jgi:hypothetical protein